MDDCFNKKRDQLMGDIKALYKQILGMPRLSNPKIDEIESEIRSKIKCLVEMGVEQERIFNECFFMKPQCTVDVGIYEEQKDDDVVEVKLPLGDS